MPTPASCCGILALANDPLSRELLEGVWSGESPEIQQLRAARQLLDQRDSLPPELQRMLDELPQEVREALEALPAAPQRPALEPLLSSLLAVGLLDVQQLTGGQKHEPAASVYSVHALVAERTGTWMEQHPEEQGDRGPAAVRQAFAERLMASYRELQHQQQAAALEAGRQAIVYLVQAGAYEPLAGFANQVVTSTRDPARLQGLLSHLHGAAEAAPPGRPRLMCLCDLADALTSSGAFRESLPFYEQAAELARQATAGTEEEARQGLSDLAVTLGNWALALRNVGDLDAARELELHAAEADRYAGRPLIQAIGSELEVLRIDVMKGGLATALPEIEQRLAQVAGWWHQSRQGQHIPEAPDLEVLSRVYIAALDIARDADYAREDWTSALVRLETTLGQAGHGPIRRRHRPGPLQSGHGADPPRAPGGGPGGTGSLPGALCRGSGHDLQGAQFPGESVRCAGRYGAGHQPGAPGPGDLRTPARSGRSRHLPQQPGDFLQKAGGEPHRREAARHQLAALLYCLSAGLTQNLQTSLGNYVIALPPGPGGRRRAGGAACG